jgi:hypothetical protein
MSSLLNEQPSRKRSKRRVNNVKRKSKKRAGGPEYHFIVEGESSEMHRRFSNGVATDFCNLCQFQKVRNKLLFRKVTVVIEATYDLCEDQ